MAVGILLHSAEHWHAQLFEFEHLHLILQCWQVRSSFTEGCISSVFSSEITRLSSIKLTSGALIFMWHASR